MPPEERRASIIEATLPLLLQHGPSLTTKQVAEAAGVAEGTIFRVFDSLPALIDATTREALSAKRLQRDLTAVGTPSSLQEVTEQAIALLVRRMTDIRSLLHTVHHSANSDDGTCLRGELEARKHEVEDWLITRLEPHLHELSDELRDNPRRFVEYLRTLALGHVFHHGDSALTTHDLAALALQGARKAR